MKLFKRKTPIILQLSSTECGIASLAMLFAYHNVRAPIEELRDQCGVSRDGCNIQTLIDVASWHGFKAEAYSVDIDTLKKLTEPVIAHWKFSHYVVINYIKGNKVSLNDPALGQTTISMDELDRSFTGVILNITPTKNTKRRPRKKLNLLFTSLSNYYAEIIFLLFCVFIATLAPYLNSRIYSLFINEYLLEKNEYFLPHIIALSLLISSILIYANYKYKCVEFKLNNKLSLIKSSNIILHILKLPMIFYSLRQRTEIIATATRVENIINLLTTNYIKIIAGFLISLICFILMIKIDYILGIFSAITILCYAIISAILSKQAFNLEKTYINTQAKLHTQQMQGIANIETIKACSLENSFYNTWEKLFIKKIQVQRTKNKISAISTTLLQSYNLVLIFLIICIGSNRIACETLSIGSLMSYYLLNLFFNTHITSTFNAVINIQSAYAQSTRIHDILLYKTDQRFLNSSSRVFIKNCDNIITCSNLTFHYNINTNPTLFNINLQIKQNQHVAFVGKTGSGKSTLVKLLCGLYQPHSGEISVYNQNLSFYSDDEITKLFSYVSQENTLFSGSILDNLTLWRETISINDVNEAIKIACLEKLIDKRGLYGTVEESGRNFSGGEKQRLEIARALLQNTPILILDEATSALDYQTEKSLIANLRKTDKTIIFVSHRMGAVSHCNQIFTLDNGRVIFHEQPIL